MLMAAGLGTRLRPFTDAEPKALLPLLGVPMAQFAVDALLQAGVTEIVANVHHQTERASAGLKRLALGGAKLTLSDESGQLLGSAGGIRKAMPLFNGKRFYLVNADVISDVDLRALAMAHERLRKSAGVKMTLTVFPAGPGSGSYREIHFDARSGLMTALGGHATGRPFFVGAAVLEPEALERVPLSGPAEFIPTILEPLLKSREVGVFLTRGIWHDIGSPELWLNAHVSILERFETTRIPLWSPRVEGVSKRIASGIWVSRESRTIAAASWVGPAYWSPYGDETARIPAELGPRAVVYGDTVAQSGSLARGIGLRGLWHRV